MKIQRLNKNYIIFIRALNGAENVKSKPSAGIALYRIVENKLEYFLLGDCSLIITKNNDEVVFLQPQELTKFDQINIDRMLKAANEISKALTLNKKLEQQKKKEDLIKETKELKQQLKFKETLLQKKLQESL